MSVTIVYNACYLINSQNNYLYCDFVKETVGKFSYKGTGKLLSTQTSSHQIHVHDIVMVRKKKFILVIYNIDIRLKQKNGMHALSNSTSVIIERMCSLLPKPAVLVS